MEGVATVDFAMPTHKAALLASLSLPVLAFSEKPVLFTHPQTVCTQGNCKESEKQQVLR